MDRIIYASLTGKQIAKNVLAAHTEKPENMQYGDSIAYFQDNSNIEFFLDVPMDFRYHILPVVNNE